MKKRRPSSENPFYSKNNKYDENIQGGYGTELPLLAKRQCKNIKKDKRCKNTLPEDRYFNCKECQPDLQLENGFDSINIK